MVKSTHALTLLCLNLKFYKHVAIALIREKVQF